MVSLAGMATPADGNVTMVVKNEVFGIINFVAIYYEKSGTPFFEKNTSERLWLKVGRGSGNGDAGTRVWGRGTRGRVGT